VLVGVRASILATLFALLASVSARAQNYDESFVDPYEAHSPDSAWALFVDPSSPDGDGPASYRLSHGKNVLWNVELPATLRDVQLGNDGAFAGTAHDDEGALRLMVVGADGQARLDFVLAYEGSWVDGPSFPRLLGTLGDFEHDRVVFRVEHIESSDTFEEWRAVRLSTGEQLSTLRPPPPFEREVAFCSIVSATPIRGAALVARGWSVLSTRGSPRARAKGARFDVVDYDGNVVWTLDLPHDYEVGADEAAADRVRAWVREYGAVREVASARRFDAWFAAEKQRVTFEVTPDQAATTGWTVREVGRDPHWVVDDPPRKSDTASGSKLGSLSVTLLGAIELQSGKLTSSSLLRFDIDDRGRLGYVVCGREQPSRFELRDAKGAVVTGWPLEIAASGVASPPDAIWLRGDRWLVHTRTYGDNPHAVAWWLDVTNGALTPIPEFDCAPIESVDRTQDGGFIVLTEGSTTHASGSGLRSFDAEGKLRWRRTSVSGGSESSLLSAKDMRVNPRGQIGVLDNSRHWIQRFDMQGEFVGVIDVDELLGRRASYPADLGAAPAGDWIVHDFNGSPPVLRISYEGTLTSQLTPHFADGRAFLPEGGIHVAFDGRMWATDGYAFLRLDEQGRVDFVVGEAPDTTHLGDVECSYIDPSGRILLADKRTHSVHVFDREGKHVAACNLAPSRVSGATAVDGISVSSDGKIHVALGNYDSTSYSAFDSSGARVGDEHFGGHVLFQTGKSSRWTIGRGEIDLHDAAGALKKHLTRGSDNRWLDPGREACVAADGSLAIVSRRKLHVFSADGAPVTSLEAPRMFGAEPLAFADGRVFVTHQRKLWCIDLASGVVRNASLGDEVSERTQTRAAWRAEANELWILDEQAKRVLRYRVKE
jgi:hypothetical protein